eukprot:271128_1
MDLFGNPGSTTSNSETQFYEQLFRSFDTQNFGTVQGGQVFGFFLSSGLTKAALGDIWDEATQKHSGGLSVPKFINAMKLIALAQRGIAPKLANIAQNPLIGLAQMQYPSHITKPTPSPQQIDNDMDKDKDKEKTKSVEPDPFGALGALPSGLGFDDMNGNGNVMETKPSGPSWNTAPNIDEEENTNADEDGDAWYADPFAGTEQLQQNAQNYQINADEDAWDVGQVDPFAATEQQNPQNNQILREAMINQLRMFGYNEVLITDAMNNVANQNDVNCIIEYIYQKQNEQQQFNDNKKDKTNASDSAVVLQEEPDKKPEENAIAPSASNNTTDKNNPFADLVKEFKHNTVSVAIVDDHNEKKQENQSINESTKNGCNVQFYNFLKLHRLEEYFDKFMENECADIRDIEYLAEDEEFIRNEIGIKSNIKRRRFIGECKQLKVEMDGFKQSNIIPPMLLKNLKTFGVVTMHILCQEGKSELDLKRKFGFNDNQGQLLWNIIKSQSQVNPNAVNQYQDDNNDVDQIEGVNDNIFGDVMDTAR